MNLYVCLVLFATCATLGWVLEVLYRSYNRKKFINPGFMTGPCLPLYGTGGLIVSIIIDKIPDLYWVYKYIGIFLVFSILMTILELIAGTISIKYYKVKLWDYSDNKFNYKGIICLSFSIIWGIIALLYNIFLYDKLLDFSISMTSNILFMFLLGLYYGIFIIDLVISLNIMYKMRRYAKKLKKVINIETEAIDARTKKLGIGRMKSILYLFIPLIVVNDYIKDAIIDIKEDVNSKIRNIKNN